MSVVERFHPQILLTDKFCPRTGKERLRIGQEVSTEYEFEPAKLIIKETVRPKYGHCGQDCCQGVTIAQLPPRLLPQSKLGLGLAVFLLLSRFDDHVAYYTLERNFLERFHVVIPRQQMVQWVEKIAHLFLVIYSLIWEELKAGGYLQVDETPVKVLDPAVKGKAATGYLWFYSVPGGDVLLEFCDGRSRAGPQARLKGFQGTIQSDGYIVYDWLERHSEGALNRIGCLGHFRRKFYKALKDFVSEGLWFILKMRELYRQRFRHRPGQVAESLTPCLNGLTRRVILCLNRLTFLSLSFVSGLQWRIPVGQIPATAAISGFKVIRVEP